MLNLDFRLRRAAAVAAFAIVPAAMPIDAHPSPAPAMASASTPDAPDFRYTQYAQTVTVDDAGRATTHVSFAIHLLTDAGRRRFSQVYVSYNADLQTVEIERAQTVHANGERVSADLKEAVFDQPAPATASAPMFSATHMRYVVFPSVRTGDTVKLDFTYADRATTFPGRFSAVAPFAPTEAFDDVTETLDTPATMRVRIDARGMQPVSDTTRDARRVRVYRYRTPAGGPARAQSESVSTLDTGPYFVATNFADYGQLARAYDEVARPAMTVTETIRQLADDITRNVTDRRQQAMLIYEWVSRNIRYLVTWVGDGPIVPHRADQVLRNGYGDCKDHDVLFVALLNAKGIRADSVLVNAGTTYRLPSAPAVSAFNHVITWLPEFGTFADSTNSFADFGTLTFPVSDKPALDTVTGELLHTPAENGANSASSSDYTVYVDDRGNADVRGSIRFDGQAASTPRAALAYGNADAIGHELLRKTGMTGALHVSAASGDARNRPFTFELTGHVDGIALMPGPAALAIPVMPAYSTIRAFSDYVLTHVGDAFDLPCAGVSVREHYRVLLPADARIIAIPPDVERDGERIRYIAKYRRDGQTVDIDRTLVRDFQTNVCSRAMLRNWYDTARAISTDLRRQILYQ
ncbi:DUF3857 domain-containing transglutaminase family protein [Burkholderia multivorans]|uniref:DUF3857 domain-containing transglutaminase family protein n=1 Tax=Burkholderia multivorans TaxID=87883 RepID=UPI0020189985|nr:DUF3857 and transglutaminase domain-containing protein [Burkholderia multivorans]MCL4648902.1 DUF3857 and transglutaminase domain-containing protein [Burkholderia multivorans]MCL4657758.1 DUF3857 and transglutaminase domain-containing protein [Burkholderia multivorans]MCO1423684.1 DUF3857 and transglutaminase domain-containing protein [Burkholderia multivorans]UQN55741.1 DUF3857 and transglutaminase domain-containing protein [Burkholderia multivorans]UQN81231.1 DUF3857 and transglutaminase 